MSANVIPIPLAMSNTFLLRGDRPILVDAGKPGEDDRLIAELARAGVKPEDLALIILTHGHTDHTGAARTFERFGVPIAIGAGDRDLLRNGKNGVLPATGAVGNVLRPSVKRMTCEGVTPQILVTEPLRLDEYGFGGEVLPVAGHTPGSCAVGLDSGEFIIGDLLRGGYCLGHLRPHRPLRHFYAEDVGEVRRALDGLLERDPRRFYVGHGGPGVDLASVRARIDKVAPHR
ncbi:MBL fold metallo-hydrolase [Mycobacterium yunnanensis]|uniref:MBL fold metallo-hydrolase n=1 Tax=Mycobacterium yunnanensis TaxID=368477 RepID=A0A9X2Z7R1_9MYCO|nr:MBL fold metallo-hydrolase [Mycobacterium yunnanensis]MCV7424503.1 MBL fold metallo-hydrolase [Mycobacterium yunnanensis]